MYPQEQRVQAVLLPVISCPGVANYPLRILPIFSTISFCSIFYYVWKIKPKHYNTQCQRLWYMLLWIFFYIFVQKITSHKNYTAMFIFKLVTHEPSPNMQHKTVTSVYINAAVTDRCCTPLCFLPQSAPRPSPITASLPNQWLYIAFQTNSNLSVFILMP